MKEPIRYEEGDIVIINHLTTHINEDGTYDYVSKKRPVVLIKKVMYGFLFVPLSTKKEKDYKDNIVHVDNDRMTSKFVPNTVVRLSEMSFVNPYAIEGKYDKQFKQQYLADELKYIRNMFVELLNFEYNTRKVQTNGYGGVKVQVRELPSLAVPAEQPFVAKEPEVKTYTVTKIKQIFPWNGEVYKVYNSIDDVVKAGYNKQQVKNCCDKKPGHKTHKGFKWEYASATTAFVNGKIIKGSMPGDDEGYFG